MMSDNRFQQATFATWLGIVLNIVLAVFKAVVGFLANSKALIADAVHSASDVVGSIAVLIGLKAAQLPPDKDHPYGHGKAESISAIVVSVILLLVGFELAINAVKAIIAGVNEPPRWFALIAIGASVISKELIFQYKVRLGRKLSSQALIANAWEHRSDAYSSIAAFVAVSGALLGKVMDWPLLYYLDPVAGVLVALLILFMGYRLVMESIHYTMDHVLHGEQADELVEAVQRVKGVITIDDLRAREHGHYVIVDTKISVNPDISVMEGHDIAREVKQALLKQFTFVSDVFVHINPYDSSPYKNIINSNDDNQSSILH